MSKYDRFGELKEKRMILTPAKFYEDIQLKLKSNLTMFLAMSVALPIPLMFLFLIFSSEAPAVLWIGGGLIALFEIFMICEIVKINRSLKKAAEGYVTVSEDVLLDKEVQYRYHKHGRSAYYYCIFKENGRHLLDMWEDDDFHKHEPGDKFYIVRYKGAEKEYFLIYSKRDYVLKEEL